MLIKLEPLMDLGRRLENIQEQLMNEAGEVAHVFQTLHTLSGMDRVEEQLKTLRFQLEDLSWSAHREAQIIADAAERYNLCERRIVNTYEDATVNYVHRDSGVVDLTDIRAILKW